DLTNDPVSPNVPPTRSEARLCPKASTPLTSAVQTSSAMAKPSEDTADVNRGFADERWRLRRRACPASQTYHWRRSPGGSGVIGDVVLEVPERQVLFNSPAQPRVPGQFLQVGVADEEPARTHPVE